MTRHGMVSPSAKGTQPPATNPGAPIVIIGVDRVATSRVPGRQHRAEAQRSGLSPSMPALPSGGHAIPDISRNPKSP
ncbi:conserved hypothetical protein [Mesorhizobium escarrei]|uniref:Propionyl-coenzyme A carboxylase alpha polypeptide n=1 Tax=Mesorhizobium escarrei TaxID=666018 RepID=A0ABM9DLT2_9HYPH|nr:conserved hypothetical protein [Mesorhizobium escarrei]